MRQICSTAKRVMRLADLDGYRMRVPATPIIRELCGSRAWELLEASVGRLGT